MAKRRRKRVGRTRTSASVVDRRGPMYPHPSGASKPTQIYTINRKRL